ncbi:MAG: CoA pyrophosphatase [Rhizobacter sp.]|nr:CoA pyrophosphatase [Burkholderiales bacterium]
MNIEQVKRQVARIDRDALGETGDMTFQERREYHRALGRTVRPAGVLILLIQRDDALNIVLTQRTAHLHDHAGQISFPGGRYEPEDTDIVATALRESFEEIGTESARIEVVGSLPNYVTVTAYEITPVVATSPPQTFTCDPFEVADAFEVPLVHVLDDANWRRDSFLREGQRREYWAVPYQERYIWGATAGMLRTFREILLQP